MVPDEQTLINALRRRTRGHIRSYGAERECAAEGCTTVLSRYNAGTVCWRHTESGN